MNTPSVDVSTGGTNASSPTAANSRSPSCTPNAPLQRPTPRVQQLDAQLRGVVREPRSDGVALELDVLVVVDAEPNVDAFDCARRGFPSRRVDRRGAARGRSARPPPPPPALPAPAPPRGVPRYPVQRVERVDADAEKPLSPSHEAPNAADSLSAALFGDDAERLQDRGRRDRHRRARSPGSRSRRCRAGPASRCQANRARAAVEAHGRAARCRQRCRRALRTRPRSRLRAHGVGMRVVTVLTTPPTAPLP